MAEYTHVTHIFEPIYNETSQVLILGTFPSVKSREQNFYYGHPRNRFWRVLAAAYELYQKYMRPAACREAVRLPSTSPANAVCGFEKLCERWRIIREGEKN